MIRVSQTPPDGPKYSFGFMIAEKEGAPDLGAVARDLVWKLVEIDATRR